MASYQEFFGSVRWDYDAILRLWSETQARLLPVSLHRGKRRQTETAEEWKERGLSLLEKHPPKKPANFDKVFGHLQRNPETLASTRDAFGLSEDELLRFGYMNPQMPELEKYETETEIRQRGVSRLEEDGFINLRQSMVTWVGLTLETKQSEALCDLQCYRCPSGQLVLCAAQNLSIIHHDSTLHEAMERYGVHASEIKEEIA